jgi:hypothetical protein
MPIALPTRDIGRSVWLAVSGVYEGLDVRFGSMLFKNSLL